MYVCILYHLQTRGRTLIPGPPAGCESVDGQEGVQVRIYIIYMYIIIMYILLYNIHVKKACRSARARDHASAQETAERARVNTQSLPSVHARTQAHARAQLVATRALAQTAHALTPACTHKRTRTHMHPAHARTHTERTRARTVPLAAVFARLLRVHIVFVFCFFHKNKCFLFFSYTFFLVGETGGRPLLSSFRNFVLFLSKFRIFGPVLVPPSYLFFLFIFIFF